MAKVMRTRERGLTLVEVMLVMAISAIFVLCDIVVSNNTPLARYAALSSFSSELDLAHHQAQTSGNGATLIKFMNSDAALSIPGYFFVICAGRPIAGTTFGSCSRSGAQVGDLTVASPALSGDWALYVNSRGSVAIGTWQTSFDNTMAGNPQDIASEPACPTGTTITLQFNDTVGSVTHTVDCDSGIFQ